MVKQRLIDGDELYGIESLLNTDIIQNSPEASRLMAQVLYDIQASPTIDPETLPIVQQLRAELANCKQELRQIKYCYDIAKNGEKWLRKQNDEITAAWAECEKKLKQVTAERDAAVADMQALMWYSGDGCEICGHKIVEQRHPYTRLGCKLNGECNPKWCGAEDKND